MRAVDIISKKRDGGELTREEIDFFVEGFTHDEIPDYQAAAWAMAVVLRGMTPRETYDLTQAMIASGERLDLSQIARRPVDKHSTGGASFASSSRSSPPPVCPWGRCRGGDWASAVERWTRWSRSPATRAI